MENPYAKGRPGESLLKQHLTSREAFAEKLGSNKIENLDLAFLRLAASQKILPALLGSARKPDESIYRTLEWVSLLLGPRPTISSETSFLLDQDIVKTRLEIFATLLPVMEAIALNKQANYVQLNNFSELILPYEEYEFFPDYFGSDRIQLPDLKKRYELGMRFIHLTDLVAKHPNSDVHALELAMIMSLAVCNFPKFSHWQKAALLNQAIPVWVAAAVHPPMHDRNVDRTQLMTEYLSFIYNNEKLGYMPENLDNFDKLHLTVDVYRALRAVINGGKELRVKHILEAFMAPLEYEEFSTETRAGLASGALPILTELAKKSKGRDIVDDIYNLLSFTPDESVHQSDYNKWREMMVGDTERAKPRISPIPSLLMTLKNNERKLAFDEIDKILQAVSQGYLKSNDKYFVDYLVTPLRARYSYYRDNPFVRK